MPSVRLIVGVLLVFSVAVAAAPKQPSGTLTLQTTAPTLGEILHFTYAVNDLPGHADPRIQVLCYKGDVLVYGEARPADEPFDPLGGASSPWTIEHGGGPAHCVATLYYWQFKPQQVFHPLDEIEFDAAGSQ